MTKYLAVVAGVLAMVGCASSRNERQEAPIAPTTEPQASSTAPARSAGAAREQASVDLASTRARLQEAQRELEAARSEWAAADAETKSAQARMDSANRLTDSVAQARAAELARAAETHERTAMTHLDYANKLVAARQADVDAAQLHVRTVEAGGGTAASDSASQPIDQRLVDAQNAENSARERASELGRAALDAQRTWEKASGRARAAARPVDATTSGTGSDTTSTGAPTSGDPTPAGR
jgi:chromosome segregation ATPase